MIISAIESAMVSAYRRAVNASAAQHVEAKIDPDSGKVMVFAEKEVVEDIFEPKTEVLLEEARKVNPDAQLGDMVIVESTPENFGRVAAQTARQVIQQRIREAERSNQMQYFERQVGEIISGVVQATNAQTTTVGLDMKAEGTFEYEALLFIPSRAPFDLFRRHGILLGRASEKAVGELMGLVPLHYEVSTWGTKKGLSYKARADQYTFAYDVRQTK